MKNISVIALLFACAAAIVASAHGQSSDPSSKTFGASAIFQPGMSAMQAARDTCAKVPGGQFGDCFVRQMQAAGASAEAVSFMHAIDNNGFMRDFTHVGQVDIAYAFYPFAANENQHCLLVNGTPDLIDVDDYKLLPKNPDLEKNKTYADLLSKFPNLAIFPGDRSGTKFIAAVNLSDGGQRFLVPYVLVNGCHACARPGSLELAFDFDRTGKFLGVKVSSVKAAAPPHPPASH